MMGKLTGFKCIPFVFGFWICWMAGGGTSLLPAAQAEESKYKNFSFYWENDAFTRTDRDYTNGLKLTMSTALLPGGRETKHMPDWSYGVMDHLPLLQDEYAFRGFALSLGHSIYTPTDTKRSDYIEDDRPYAGYLYVGFGLQAY